MPTPNTVTTLDNAMKIYYSAGQLVKLAYEYHPLYAMLPKSKDFYGKHIPIVPWYGGSQGRSRTFATAQSNASDEKTEEFQLTRKKDYGVSYIELEALFATENDAGSFLKLGTDAVDRIKMTVINNLATSLYRNHGGARGRISAIATNTITLTNPGDVVNFEVNMKLRHGQTDGTSGALEAEAASAVTAVDDIAGTITIADATGFDVGNYLFAEGDFGASIHGLQSWIPTSVSPAENFLGVDRSVDARLRGMYLNANTAGYDHLEALEVLSSRIRRRGGKPSVVFVNPEDLRIIKTQLGSQLEYDNAAASGDASISFKTLVLPGVGKLVEDPDCPQGEGYMLAPETWKFYSLGEAPRGLNGEGGGFKFITQMSSDQVEVRIGYYGNLACFMPGHNGRVTFAS